jgi:glucose-6-phosphate 1-dehydrogenase
LVSAATWKNPPNEERGMTVPHSDALIFFGATGDLAYKKICPALQAIIKRGHVDVPVIIFGKSVFNPWKEKRCALGLPPITVDLI